MTQIKTFLNNASEVHYIGYLMNVKCEFRLYLRLKRV